jgi:hypothetical protein
VWQLRNSKAISSRSFPAIEAYPPSLWGDGRKAMTIMTICKPIVGGAVLALAAAWCVPALAADAPPDSFWSRVTLEVPAFTRHTPHDSYFNDHNWGLFVDVKLNDTFSVVGGDFDNSYRKNTAFAAVAIMPLRATVGHVAVSAGGMVGLDLTNGYHGHNDYEPALGALSLRLNGAGFEGQSAFLNRLGLLTTIIPADPNGGSTAINVAVTWRLQ